jgi:hypothetical protein
MTCDPNPCPTLGACCYGGQDNLCSITTEANCPHLWIGQQPCDPDACVLPVERSTWGQIKSRYKGAR